MVKIVRTRGFVDLNDMGDDGLGEYGWPLTPEEPRAYTDKPKKKRRPLTGHTLISNVPTPPPPVEALDIGVDSEDPDFDWED